MTDADLIRKPFSEDYDLYKNGVKTYILKRKPFSENYDLYDLYGNLYKEDGLSFELRRKPWSNGYDLYKGGELFEGIIGGEEPVWSPTDIGGCKRWLRSDLGVTKDELNRISNGADQSGNDLDGSQATDSKKPVEIANQLNGKPIWRADGIDDILVKTNVTRAQLFPNINEGSFFYIMKQSTTEGGGLNGWGTEPADQVMILAAYAGSTIYFDFSYAGGTGRTTVATPSGWLNAWHILVCVRRSDGTQIIRVDRTTLSSEVKTSTIADTISDLKFLNTRDLSYPFKGDFAEEVIHSVGYTDEDIALLETYALATWGI